jgi:perosamine synthetase
VYHRISLSQPYIDEEDIHSVEQAFREGRLSQGKYVEKFEKEFAKYVRVKHAIAVSNGTAALHLALAALDVGPGDEVLVPSFSFIATSNCVLYQAAKPVFVDIDPLTYDIDPQKIVRKINKRTKVVIPVHYAGQPCDMDSINEVATRFKLHVVEDAAEAHGALYKNRKAGSLGDIACFSFYPNKNMTTGEGGMVTTDDDKIAEKVRLARSHGQDYRYHHIALGYNYRMTDIQGALGLTQLQKLDWILQKKAQAADYYSQNLTEITNGKVEFPYVAPYATHTYMLYPILFQNRHERDLALRKLTQSGVEAVIHFPPIHLQPLYRNLFHYRKGYLPITEKTAETILSIPLYALITQEDQDYVLENIHKALR